MKYRFKVRRTGGELLLFQLFWVVVTVLSFGLAGLFWPVALAIYVINGIEVEAIQE